METTTYIIFAGFQQKLQQQAEYKFRGRGRDRFLRFFSLFPSLCFLSLSFIRLIALFPGNTNDNISFVLLFFFFRCNSCFLISQRISSDGGMQS